MLAPSPIQSQISHTLFDIISLGVDTVLCHVRREQFILVHGAKCHSTISWIMWCLVIFPWLVSRQQYVHRQATIDTTLPLPYGVQVSWIITLMYLSTRLFLIRKTRNILNSMIPDSQCYFSSLNHFLFHFQYRSKHFILLSLLVPLLESFLLPLPKSNYSMTLAK